MKISYCFTKNAENIIKSLNKKFSNSDNHHAEPWNCRGNAQLKAKFINV